MTNSLENET